MTIHERRALSINIGPLLTMLLVEKCLFLGSSGNEGVYPGVLTVLMMDPNAPLETKGFFPGTLGWL
jgi:hypothetical protein